MRNYYKLSLGFLSILILASQSLYSQSVTGKVIDENNEGIPGVLVQVMGTTKGAATDLEGIYTLELEKGSYVLNFSFLGYSDRQMQVDLEEGQTLTMDVNLSSETKMLDELVIVGYGVQRQRDVTGAISKIDPKQLTAIPNSSFEANMQGQAAGIQVTQGGGIAGSASIVRIRGIASISAGGDPLYVIDGIPITQDYFLLRNNGAMNNNPLATINPYDIESVEILKDAAATGIYGSRGANGVILITTKRGRKKGLSVDLTVRGGLSTPTARPNMLETPDYLQLYQEAWENDGNVGPSPLPGKISWEDARKTNTNWVDETTQLGVKSMVSVGITKGTEKLNSYFNLSYDNNESFFKGNSYRRISGRANLDYRFSNKLSANLNMSVASGWNSRVDNSWTGGYGSALSTALPIYPIYVTDSTGKQSYFNAGSNPTRDLNEKKWRTLEFRSINSLTLTYTPMSNLIFNVRGGYDYMDLAEERWESSIITGSTNNLGTSTIRPNWVNNWNLSLTGNYLWDLNEQNKFNFMLGGEYQQSITIQREQTAVNASGPTWEEGGWELSQDNRLSDKIWKFSSFFGRVNYNLKGRYIFQATGRVDGSSKFGSNFRTGFFPSASAGWILSEEDWYNLNKMNYLKLKGSFGRTGNAAIPDYETFETWAGPDRSNPYNGSPIIYPEKLENPNLRWETSNTFDVGVEAGFFTDRITVDFNYYNKVSKDVLLQVTIPPSIGFSNFWDNVAEIRNQGLELALKTRNLVGSLKWNTTLNVARNFNELVSIGNYTQDAVAGGTNDTRVVVGEPVGTNFLVKFSHVDKLTGDPIYLDINGNETRTWDPIDRVPVGNVLPKAVGGFENTFSYRNFDLGLLLTFSLGGNIYDSSSKRQLGVVTDWNMRTDLFDRWRKPGDDAKYPRLTQDEANHGAGTPWINTDLWLHKADYLRFRRLYVAYNIPKFNFANTKAKMRVELSITNFITITNFPGLDPEIARDFENAADRNLSPNITYLTPPQERSYNLTVNFQF
jgi:TonB-dependent starch-binding outer membrane protein SusC